ncbi:MAG: prolipoprotein diacylglyceryl transferase [Leucobacter sp.]
MIFPFSIPSPDVQFIEVGPFRLYFYAFCLIAGMIAAGIWSGIRLRRRGGEAGAAIDFGVWAVVFGIIGARLYHVVTHWGDYFGEGKNPLDIFAFWQGGIAIFGALLGGAVGVFLASRISTHVRFWSFADALVPGLMLGQIFGRLGNWFNNELFGGPTTLPWGLEIASSNPAFPVGLPDGTLFHPTFLYEILWNILGIVVLLAIERRWRPRWGQFFGLYLIWYGIGRVWVESLRVDPSLLFLGLRTNVLAAILAIVVGIVIIVVQRRRHPGIESSIYLPGYSHPQDSVLEETEDSDQYYHVIDRGDTEATSTDGGSESDASETETSDNLKQS